LNSPEGCKPIFDTTCSPVIQCGRQKKSEQSAK
jgi:hypothetical protein